MMLGEKVLIVATMKNEGPYVLEWVAHYLALGVDGILVFTNDCDDLTDRMLDRLERIVPVYHRPNPKALMPDRGNWHVMALRYARMFNIYRDADWIYHTDADELLQIFPGEGHLDDFMAAAQDRAGRFDAVSFTSTPFSSAGILTLQDRPVAEQFTQLSKGYAKARAEGRVLMNAIKTMYRNDVPFDLRRNHRPLMKGFLRAGHVWIDGSANVLGPDFTDGKDKAIEAMTSTDLAQFNHYAIKSAEAFLVKLDRGDAMGLDRLQRSHRYWQGYNGAGDPEPRFATMRPATRRIYEELKADPQLAEMHAQSFAIHKAKAARMRQSPDWAGIVARLGLG
ncbi:glycosyltransferase family 2 protein [Phaeovulum sp. NW3]|uniref:glycosyltransferase family 2 protein n=1 Tax=Phaeovulum sp. NW3 TaxID=2934933 RepID=UPI00202037CB|nr:glycosyltransferase family 2 protein [Phaeovulum sp. NW3]MCL7463427.1 glycosyltransferase family 2 protein [Phaeovulum sp. NW3]